MSTELSDWLQRTLGSSYRIQRELAGGGMARVFIADAPDASRIVIKVLSPDLIPGVNGARFRREIHLAEQLQHPNIVPVLNAGQAADLLFFTMPLIEGETLRSYLERERRLSLARTVEIIRDVAGALDHAHARNVVHRDIKPENILIDGGSGRALVTDFGIARAIEKAADIDSVTSTGLTLGTPRYMSPEQAAGERHIDGRSDIYSLACVTYELLTGAPPFDGPTAQALIARHLSEMPRSLRDTRPDLPRYVDDAVQRALAKMPSERFSNAAELACAVTGTTAIDIALTAHRSGRTRLVWGLAALACATIFVLFALARWS